MTAPTRSVGTKTKTFRRPVTVSSDPTEQGHKTSRSRATVARAYARKAQRTKSVAAQRTPTSVKSRNAPFAVMVIVILALGIAAIMWLSTQATADSYRLQDARAQVTELTRQVEQLEREVAVAQSPVELGKAATSLGMVPAGDPARLLKLPDGRIEQFGDPKPAVAPAPPTVNAPAANPVNSNE